MLIAMYDQIRSNFEVGSSSKGRFDDKLLNQSLHKNPKMLMLSGILTASIVFGIGCQWCFALNHDAKYGTFTEYFGTTYYRKQTNIQGEMIVNQQSWYEHCSFAKHTWGWTHDSFPCQMQQRGVLWNVFYISSVILIAVALRMWIVNKTKYNTVLIQTCLVLAAILQGGAVLLWENRSPIRENQTDFDTYIPIGILCNGINIIGALIACVLY